jgi:hypothetical protein
MGTEADVQAAMDTRGKAGKTAGPATGQPAKTGKKRVNMHDGIAVWADCCSCAAEPYWLAVAEEMGIDLGSDYEDEDAESAPKS